MSDLTEYWQNLWRKCPGIIHDSKVPECPPQSLHQFCPDWLDVFIEKVWLEIVNTQLKCPQSLRYKILRSIESRDHQHWQLNSMLLLTILCRWGFNIVHSQQQTNWRIQRQVWTISETSLISPCLIPSRAFCPGDIPPELLQIWAMSRCLPGNYLP